MKTHEQKMHEKKEHEAELERNDLYAWLVNVWTKLKTGEIVSKKFALAAVALGAIVAIIYLLTPRRWRLGQRGLAEARNHHRHRGTERVCQRRTEHYAGQSGPAPICQATARPPGRKPTQQHRAEHPRQSDPEHRRRPRSVHQAHRRIQRRSHAASSGHRRCGPRRTGARGYSEGRLDFGFRGSVEKAIELFRQYAKLAGDTAGESARKMADELEAKKSDVEQLGRFINARMAPLTPPPISRFRIYRASPRPGSATPPK